MVVCELEILLVEKKQLFAFICKPYDDLLTAYVCAVICVLRNTNSEHYVVCDIYQRIDRPHSGVSDE